MKNEGFSLFEVMFAVIMLGVFASFGLFAFQYLSGNVEGISKRCGHWGDQAVPTPDGTIEIVRVCKSYY